MKKFSHPFTCLKTKVPYIWSCFRERNLANGLLTHPNHTLKRHIYILPLDTHLILKWMCIMRQKWGSHFFPHYRELEHIYCSVRPKWEKKKKVKQSMTNFCNFIYCFLSAKFQVNIRIQHNGHDRSWCEISEEI